MKTLKRIKEIIASNISHLIEQSEDPAQVIEKLIREMDETIVTMRMSVARVIAVEKQMAHKGEDAEQAIKDWAEKAREAVKNGDDESARHALARKLAAEKAVAELGARHEQAELGTARMKEQLQRMEEKLLEARRREDLLASRKKGGAVEKGSLAATEQFDRTSRQAATQLGATRLEPEPGSLDDEVNRIETELEARQELAASINDPESELTELVQEEQIESALADLKRVLGF